jgi:hypothetical protein
MKRIAYDKLPKKAIAAISKRQRTYIDEFVFRQYKNGLIAAYYAGDLVGVWDGRSWNSQEG